MQNYRHRTKKKPSAVQIGNAGKNRICSKETVMKRHFTIICILFAAPWSFANTPSREKETKASPACKIQQDIAYREKSLLDTDEYIEERCRLDIYYPSKQSNFATVVWFHGGGLTEGERFIPEQLKDQNIAVVAVDYRLSPKVVCPAYIDDAAAAVAWTFKNIRKYSGDPNLIFVSGHSAGGYLTCMVGLDKKWLAVYGIDADKIAGLIPISGQAITHFTIRQERGIPDKRPVVDEFAPLFHVRPDAPVLVLITGDRNLELLGRYEENAYLMRMMKIAGHQKTFLYEIQGFNHGEMVTPAYSIMLKHINDIIKTYRK